MRATTLRRSSRGGRPKLKRRRGAMRPLLERVARPYGRTIDKEGICLSGGSPYRRAPTQCGNCGGYPPYLLHGASPQLRPTTAERMHIREPPSSHLVDALRTMSARRPHRPSGSPAPRRSDVIPMTHFIIAGHTCTLLLNKTAKAKGRHKDGAGFLRLIGIFASHGTAELVNTSCSRRQSPSKKSGVGKES